MFTSWPSCPSVGHLVGDTGSRRPEYIKNKMRTSLPFAQVCTVEYLLLASGCVFWEHSVAGTRAALHVGCLHG